MLRRLLGRTEQAVPPMPKVPEQAMIYSNGEFKPLRSAFTGISKNIWGSLYGRYSNFNDAQLTQAYTSSITAYSAVNMRATLAGQIPVKAVLASGNELDIVSPAQDFIQHSPKMLWWIMVSLLIYGEAYLLKRYNVHRLPTGLKIINPEDIDPIYDHNDILQGYRLQGQRDTVLPRHVVRLMLPNPADDTNGLSPTEVAMRSIDIEHNLSVWLSSFFYNSARPDGILFYTGQASEQEESDRREMFKRQFKGRTNKWRILFGMARSSGGGEWKWTQITSNLKDLETAPLLNQQRQDICAAFRVNPVLCGFGQVSDQLSAQSTYENIWSQHMLNVAIPDVQWICQELTEQWLRPDFESIFPGLALEPDTKEIVANSKSTANRATTAQGNVANNIMQINEAREFTGLEPLDGIHIAGNPNWALQVYNAGGMRLNELRESIGLDPIPGKDLFIYELDPRQSGQQPQTPSFNPFFNIQQPSTLGTAALQSEPIKIPESKILQLPARALPENLDAQLAELSNWQKKVRKKGRAASWNIEHLSTDVALYVRTELDEYWPVDAIFDKARNWLRQGDEPEAFGASPEEAAAAWSEFDAVQDDMGIDWLTYLKAISPDVVSAATNANDPLKFELPGNEDAREQLLDSWIGTPEQPGPLAKFVIAGYAAGTNALNSDGSADYRQLEFTVDFDLANTDSIAFLREYGGELITALDDTTLKRIVSVLVQAQQEGWSGDRIQQELADVLILAGEEPSAKVLNRAKLIADNESIKAFNEGAFNRWESAGVTRSVWRTVRDEHVCPICRPLDGAVANFREGWPAQNLKGESITVTSSAHVGCRCFRRPVAN